MADLILLLHVLFVAFVVLSVPMIMAGALRKWRWVHNPAFRLTHLAAIGIVAAESLIGIPCPLTVWESAMRAESYGEKGFIAHWLHALLFYDLPGWAFTLAYCSFAALIAGLLYWVPVRKASS